MPINDRFLINPRFLEIQQQLPFTMLCTQDSSSEKYHVGLGCMSGQWFFSARLPDYSIYSIVSALQSAELLAFFLRPFVFVPV